MNYQRSRKYDGSAQPPAVLDFPHSPAPPHPSHGGIGTLLRSMGPGFVTGVANIDPSVVVTATVVGAAFRFSLLWVIVLCIPFLFTVFAVAARMGYETRKGLVDLLRENYGKRWRSCARW